METTAVLLLVFSFLLAGLFAGVPLAWPLLAGLGCLVALCLRRGFAPRKVGAMALDGAGKALPVLQIFLLIGALTAVWRACGTVAFIVYHGLALINAQYFLLCAFLLCCLVSFLLGTSFGTVGTVGVVLIVLAQSGHVDVSAAAGAIIAGAYFGDRCSPMSSSAALVAALTGTALYDNVKNMLRSSALPLALSLAAYAWLSRLHPLTVADSRIGGEILRHFDIGLVTLLPAAVILLAAAFRIEVKLSMGLSIFAGALIGIFVQHQSLWELLTCILCGYRLEEEGFFAAIIQGGGLLAMLNVGLVVLVSSAYAGLFEGAGLLRDLEGQVERLSQKIGVYATTVLTGTAAAAFGCNQTFAAILAHQFARKVYERRRLGRDRLALDLENTVIVISALIPWNVAGAFPAAALSADSGFIPYAFYLFLVPLLSGAQGVFAGPALRR